MKSKLNLKKSYLATYTIFFFLLLSIVFLPFIINGKTLVGLNDSYTQHYPFILKIKAFYENILFHHKFVLIDPNDYMGLDVFDLYAYYGLGNPFNFLFIGWSSKFIPYIFSFIVILKLYLGGISFQYLGKELNLDKKITLLCSLLYVINPFAISALEQFCFFDVLYQLPLLIAGLHQILKKGKSKLFFIVITITFMCGFYWLYIQTIILIVYALYYVFSSKITLREKGITTIKGIINTAKYYILGFLLSAWIFVPSLLTLSKMFRLSSKNTFNLLFYSLDEIQERCLQILFYNSRNWVTIWFLFIPIVVFMVKNIKEYKRNLVIIICLYIASFIPAVGYITNGFSYPINRWFIGAYLFILLLCINPLNAMLIKSKAPKIIVIFFIIVLGILQPLLFNLFYSKICLAPKQFSYGYINLFGDKIHPEERVDFNGDQYDNSITIIDRCSMNFYNSSISKRIIETYIKYGLSSLNNTNIISGLNQRAELEALYSVDKFFGRDNQPVPYGFKKVYEDDKDNILYENMNPLHFGYTYNSYINESKADVNDNPSYTWNALNSCLIEEEYTKNVAVSESVMDNSQFDFVKYTVNTPSESETQFIFEPIHDSEVYAQISIKNSKLTSLNISTSKNKLVKKICEISSPWFIKRDSYYINLGYFDEISSFSISCKDEFKVEKILYHKMDGYKERIAALNEYHLENVSYDENTFRGSIDIPDNRILCLSIPFQTGWSATVDNKPVQIMPVNGCFMGINLSPGKHSIKLTYMNPGFIPGILITCITVFVLFCYYLYKRLKNKAKIDNNLIEN